MHPLPDGERQRLYEAFIHASTDFALVLLDAQGHVLTWNPGAERILGYTADDLLGQHLRAMYTEDDRRMQVPEHELKTAAATGRASDDRWLLQKSGTRVWVSGVTAAIKDGDTIVGFGKVIRDQTAIREQHDRIQQLNAELQAKVAEMEDFEQMTVGRELKMMELKRENERLRDRIGRLDPEHRT